MLRLKLKVDVFEDFLFWLEVVGIRNQIRLGKFRTITLLDGPEYFRILILPVFIQGYITKPPQQYEGFVAYRHQYH
jgi:hypothetical protein